VALSEAASHSGSNQQRNDGQWSHGLKDAFQVSGGNSAKSIAGDSRAGDSLTVTSVTYVLQGWLSVIHPRTVCSPIPSKPANEKTQAAINQEPINQEPINQEASASHSDAVGRLEYIEER
jgi:hypothetical protein